MGSTYETAETILPWVKRIPRCKDISLQDTWMKDDDQYEITY